jgi:hypothetical protein
VIGRPKRLLKAGRTVSPNGQKTIGKTNAFSFLTNAIEPLTQGNRDCDGHALSGQLG